MFWSSWYFIWNLIVLQLLLYEYSFGFHRLRMVVSQGELDSNIFKPYLCLLLPKFILTLVSWCRVCVDVIGSKMVQLAVLLKQYWKKTDTEASCEGGFQECSFMLLQPLFAGQHMKLESPFSKITTSRKIAEPSPKKNSS